MIDYRDYLRLLPKVELHCHFVATIRPATLVELARRHDVPLPAYDVDALFDYDNIVDFLTVFEAANRVFVDRGVFERVAYGSYTIRVARDSAEAAKISPELGAHFEITPAKSIIRLGTIRPVPQARVADAGAGTPTPSLR